MHDNGINWGLVEECERAAEEKLYCLLSPLYSLSSRARPASVGRRPAFECLAAARLLVAAVFTVLSPGVAALAQATPTATKTADVSVFAGFLSASPDYGPYRNTGGSLGLNFTRYFHLPVAPSLELRANLADGDTVNERTYLFGLRAQAEVLRRFHPYADLLVGPGNIHFNFPNGGYTGDNSLVYSY